MPTKSFQVVPLGLACVSRNETSANINNHYGYWIPDNLQIGAEKWMGALILSTEANGTEHAI